jgi:hypothetical protein
MDRLRLKEKENKGWESMLSMLIEIASLCDLVSDCVILTALYHSTHTMWLTITVFTISCPYFTCYTSLMTWHISQVRKIREEKDNR